MVRRFSRRLNVLLGNRRSRFTLYHVQIACSSSRRARAPAEPSTATARLRRYDSSERQTTTSLVASSSAYLYEKDREPLFSHIEDTLEPHLDPKALGLDPFFGQSQLGMIASIIFRRSKSYKKEGEKSMRTRMLQMTGKELEASSAQSKISNVKYSKRPSTMWCPFSFSQNSVWRSFSGLRNVGQGVLNAEDTPLIRPSPTEQPHNIEKTGQEQGINRDPFNTQEERNRGRSAAEAMGPTTDPLSTQLQGTRTRNSNSEAVHEPEVRMRHPPCSDRGERGEVRNRAREPLPRDTLYAQLRNPKGTHTGSTAASFKTSFSEDAKPGHQAARVRREPALHAVIRSASVEDIERKLYHIAHHNPNVDGVQFILKELIEVRHIQPQAQHYEALILANCEAQHGSADALYPILAEMEREKIGIGVSTLNAVLKVLSIHPDAQLLSLVLQTFASQWSTPTVSDTVHNIQSLTRLNQFELALSNLENLISISPAPSISLQTTIPQYVYTGILYRLASPIISDHTAALQLLYLLNDNNLPISDVCIFYLLDSAAEALHLELTLYLWRSHVDTEYIIPSTGLCRNALLTAARNGKAELARKAARVLENRDDGLKVEELEMVMEAFEGDKESWVGFAAMHRVERMMLDLRRKDQIRREKEQQGKEESRPRKKEEWSADDQRKSS